MQEELNSIDAVSRAINRVKREGRFAEFTLTNGIVLSLKPVAPLLIQAISQEFKAPKPPKIFIEEKGREEENPNDPNYIKELETLVAEQDTAINDLLLGLGTSVKFVPEGYFPPESDEWITQVEFAAKLTKQTLDIDKADQTKRYLCWLRFYAMETGADVALCSGLPLQLAGIREGEIEEVVDFFRSLPERRTNTDSEIDPGSENGNTANRATRRASPRN